jgi:hypothetical protein
VSESPPEPLGVFVLGMHRSGTSVLTRVVDLLGVPVAQSGMLTPDASNLAGYWEPRTLNLLNERLLTRLGGSWPRPPAIEVLAHCHTLLADELSAARDAFRALHPGPQWVWKDPRNCLLLPFWRAALGGRAVVVLSYRDPAEVAASMARHRLVNPLYALALWERYLQAAVLFSRGVPSLVVGYRDLAVDPDAMVTTVAEFLEGHGAALGGPEGRSRAAASVDRSLRREHTREPGTWGRLSPEQARLAAELAARAAGGALDGLALEPESAQTTRLLDAAG